MNCNCNNKSNALDAPKIKHVFGNVLRLAIPLTLRTIELEDVEVDGVVTQQAVATDTDFIPSGDNPVVAVFSKGAAKVKVAAEMRDGNIAFIEDKGTIPVGTYEITITCSDDNGNPYRFNQRSVLQVVSATADAGIETPIEYETMVWYLDAAIYLALKGEDGVGIDDIETQSSGEIGGVNTVTFILTDGRTRSFNILNGSGAVDSDLDINSHSPIANSAVTAKFNELSGELADLFGDVDYDTSSKTIRFWDKGKTNVLASLDARPFIKDGMVSNAYISNNTLVITFNTDSGKEAIGVPLTTVFNPNNYYTKTQVDSRIASAVANINLTNYYTKSQTDTMVSRITPYEVTFTTGNNSNIVCDNTIANIYQNYTNHKPIIAKYGESVGTLVYIKGGENPEAAFLFGDRYDSPYLLRNGVSGWGKEELGADIEVEPWPSIESDKPVASDGVAAALAQKVSSVTINGTTKTPDEDGDVSFTVEGGSGGYEPPVGGIPKTDLASGVQSSLDAADSAYQKPNGGIPASDLSSAVQTSLGKADTALQSSDLEGYATTDDVDDAVAALVSSAPQTLDTLNELAEALGDDPNFATTMATQLGNKVDKETGKGLSTNDYTTAEKTKLAGIAAGAEVNVQPNWTQTNTSADDYIKNKPTLATVATSGSYNDLQDKPTIPSGDNDIVGISDGTASDGAVVFSRRNGDTVTLDFNHSHPQYALANSLSTVATSGDYDDLTGKPTKVSDFTNDSGFTTNVGTVTGIKMNNGSAIYPTNGVVDLGTVITSHQALNYTGSTGNVITANTSINTALAALDTAIGDVESLLASI